MPIAILHSSVLLSGKAIREKGGRNLRPGDATPTLDGALVVESPQEAKGRFPRILWVGKTSALPPKFKRAKRVDLEGARAILPGFVDCHTHLVFAGDRADEFAQRAAGKSYQELALAGGGILSTVRATRQATESQLFALSVHRVKMAMKMGIRALEIKSGYGLDEDAEFKILKVAQRLKTKFRGQVEFHITYLGAHAAPPEGSQTDYVRKMVQSTLPRIAQKRFADSVDVFMDEGYYSHGETQQILETARSLGLAVRLHADELSDTSAAALAVRLGAMSADHLLKVSDQGIQELSRSSTVAVLLPATAFYLKAPQAPARKLLNSGAQVALATDFNPGTSMTQSIPFVMTLAALQLQMTSDEIFAAVTYNAACALGLENRMGTLDVGKSAAYWVSPFSKFEDLYYRVAAAELTG